MQPSSLSITVQFLEGSAPHARIVSSRDAVERLRQTLHCLPLGRVLLGWNLPEAVVEACADECQRQNIDLYLWHPLLTSDGSFTPPLVWSTVGIAGKPVPGHERLTEFTFLCPNLPEVQEAVLFHLEKVLASGYYQGVFLDRIRFPSPANRPDQDLACFCPACCQAAGQVGIDLPKTQSGLLQAINKPHKRLSFVASLLASTGVMDTPVVDPLTELLAFRQESVTGMVQAAVQVARRQGLKVGLDCFSPRLAVMVGQNLLALSRLADWVKVMCYIRAFGPATIPFELLGLASWLREGGLGEVDTLSYLRRATGWALPETYSSIRHGELESTILTSEISSARIDPSCELLAGIELVELAGVSELHASQIRADLATLVNSGANGLVLSWDAWLMPPQRLSLVREELGL